MPGSFHCSNVEKKQMASLLADFLCLQKEVGGGADHKAGTWKELASYVTTCTKLKLWHTFIPRLATCFVFNFSQLTEKQKPN